MGKKEKAKVYLSKSGRASQKEGMYKKEKKSRKITYCICFGFSFLLFLIFGAVYASRAVNANAINADYWVDKNRASPYDSCQITGYDAGDLSQSELANLQMDMGLWCLTNAEFCMKRGTGWSEAFNFNAAMLILMSLNFITMTIGAFWYYPRLIGTFCNCCCGCCHFAAFTVALAYRTNPLGAYCSANVAGIQYEGNGKYNDSWTYKKDGGVLMALGAIQIILWCVQCYCCCLPLYWTPSVDEVVVVKTVEKKEKKKKKKKDGGSGSGSSS